MNKFIAELREKWGACLARVLCGAMLKLFFQLEIRGAHHLPASGPVILAGNHTGFLDGPLVFAAFKRRFRFIVAREVLGWRWVGPLVARANIIPIASGAEKSALREALRDLRNGGSICIFPEGKLTGDGEMNGFREGVAFLERASGAPIVPFAISGGFEAWAWGQKWPRFRKIILQFGEPLPSSHSANKREAIVGMLRRKIEVIKTTLEFRSPNKQPT